MCQQQENCWYFGTVVVHKPTSQIARLCNFLLDFMFINDIQKDGYMHDNISITSYLNINFS